MPSLITDVLMKQVAALKLAGCWLQSKTETTMFSSLLLCSFVAESKDFQILFLCKIRFIVRINKYFLTP